MNRVLHFELGADDPEKLIAFYKEVFGWETHQWEGPQTYWLVSTGPSDKPGINGGIMRHKETLPHTINTIGVDSIDEHVKKVEE